MLAVADSGTLDGREKWCCYVLQGVLAEMQKVDHLADFGYLRRNILTPALEFARERQLINRDESAILSHAITAGVIKAGDLAAIMPDLNANQRTYQIRKLVDQKMLQPTREGSRQYTAGFANNYLIRGVIKALTDEGFIPDPLAKS